MGERLTRRHRPRPLRAQTGEGVTVPTTGPTKPRTHVHNMKPQTKVLDLQKLLAIQAAEKSANAARQAAQRELDAVIKAARLPALIDPVTLSRATLASASLDAAKAAYAKIPRARRETAETVAKFAMEYARSIARHYGGEYSGNTTARAEWGTAATARTYISRGEQYSRRCTYRKTDAEHVVTLDPARVHALHACERLRQLSAADGLALIALDDDGSAVWVKTTGKAITHESGWVIGDDVCCYHSTQSRAHAAKGHARKRARIDAERAEIEARRLATTPGTPEYIAAQKADRRARLITRLCKGATATIADARRLGYCVPGIEAFQRAHGIGDAAPLPDLIKTGNPSAVRLALEVARKLAKAA